MIREPYVGPALTGDEDDSANADNGSNADHKPEEFHTRPPTRSGGRNLQDSSFSFSGWLNLSVVSYTVKFLSL